MDFALSDEQTAIVQTARRYAREFPASPDVLLLGMGDDGHTASLFPGAAELDATDARFVPATGPTEPRRRISATRPTILSAREVIVLTAGASKADALYRVFSPDGSIEATPARIATGGAWFVDAEAAAHLVRDGAPPGIDVVIEGAG